MTMRRGRESLLIPLTIATLVKIHQRHNIVLGQLHTTQEKKPKRASRRLHISPRSTRGPQATFHVITHVRAMNKSGFLLLEQVVLNN